MATLYWVGGSANWELATATNWSLTSGGAGGAQAPTTADDVIFDANSGVSPYTVTMAGGVCKSLTVSGASGLTFAGSGDITIAGNMTLTTAVTWSVTGRTFFTATASGSTITTAGRTFPGSIIIAATGAGTYTSDSITTTSDFFIESGTFSTSSARITCNGFNMIGGLLTTTGSTNLDRVRVTGNNRTIISITGGSFNMALDTYISCTYSGSTGTRNIVSNQDDGVNINIVAGSDTVSGGFTVRNLNFTGFSGTLSGTSSYQLSGNLTLSSNMNITSTSDILCISPAQPQTITTNNNPSIPMSLVMYATGSTATVTLVGTWNGTLDSNLSFERGTFTFNSNSYNMTVGNVLMSFPLGAGSTCTFGSSNINVLNTFVLSVASTVNANTSTINVEGFSRTAGTFNRGSGTINCSGSFNGGGGSYWTVNLTGESQNIEGANTFNTLTINDSGSSGGTAVVRLAADQTVTGTLTTSSGGTFHRRRTVRSNVAGTVRTITAATANIDYTNFMDITAAGASSPWSGTSVQSFGNNTNINFTAPKTVYWSSTGGVSASWVSDSWALISGGTGSLNNYPLEQDTVIIDNAGLGVSNTITLNADVEYLPTIDSSTRTNAMIIDFGANNGTRYAYKDISIGSGVTVNGSGSGSPSSLYITQNSPGTALITDFIPKTTTFVNNGTIAVPVTFENVTTPGLNISGTFNGLTITNSNLTLTGNTTVTILNSSTGTTTLNSGTLNFGEYTFATAILTATSSAYTLNFGTGKMQITGTTGTVLNLPSGSAITTGSKDVEVTGSTGSPRTITLGTSFNESTSLNFKVFSSGTVAGLIRVGNLDLTGFSGTLADPGTSGRTIYGDLTLGSSTNTSSGTNVTRFSKGTGTQTITSSGRSYNQPITVETNITLELADALNLGTSTFTISAADAVLNTNNYNVTCGNFNG